MSAIDQHFSTASTATYYGTVRLNAYQLIKDLRTSLGQNQSEAEKLFKRLWNGYREIVYGTNCFSELLLEVFEDEKDPKRLEKATQLATLMKQNKVVFHVKYKIEDYLKNGNSDLAEELSTLIS
jgi:hypothetical protein